MSETIPEPDPTLSRDAQHSTYEQAPVDPDVNPPAGPGVIQTLGKPAEAPAAKASSKASTSASS